LAHAGPACFAAYAFDERRVRETDVLQSVALAFAIVLGVVSSWNEFLAQYIANWKTGWWVGIGGAAIVCVTIAIWRMRRYLSHLTSRKFKMRFQNEPQKPLAAYFLMIISIACGRRAGTRD
jgi:hypothetical protein